jgi:tRNA U54 and U55 pseudouridine synthase Pus10
VNPGLFGLGSSHNNNKEVVGADGETYQLEVDVHWDEKKGQDIRVFVSADDGRGWPSLAPLTRSFIKRPDGTLVGE